MFVLLSPTEKRCWFSIQMMVIYMSSPTASVIFLKSQMVWFRGDFEAFKHIETGCTCHRSDWVVHHNNYKKHIEEPLNRNNVLETVLGSGVKKAPDPGSGSQTLTRKILFLQHVWPNLWECIHPASSFLFVAFFKFKNYHLNVAMDVKAKYNCSTGNC